VYDGLVGLAVRCLVSDPAAHSCDGIEIRGDVMTRLFITFLLATALVAATSGSAKPEPAPITPLADPKAKLLAAEMSAWQTAKPTFMKYCTTCHTKDGRKATQKKLNHFAMDTYPFGGHHGATIGLEIRHVLGLTGKAPTMPADKRGAVKGDELATIKAWADAWEAAEKAGAHPAVEAHHD
jgi:hypothetical protein